MRTHLLVLVVAAACATPAKPPSNSPTSSAERTRATCEDGLRHVLDIRRAHALLVFEDGGEAQRQALHDIDRAYDVLRNEPEFLAECRLLSDAMFACVLRATNRDELDACSGPPDELSPEMMAVLAIPEQPSCPVGANLGTGSGKLTGNTLTADAQARLWGVEVIATPSIQTGDTSAFATTDASGTYVFEDLPAGHYQLDFIYADRRVVKECVVVPGGALTVVDVAMQVAVAQP